MATSSNTFHSNSIQGYPQVGGVDVDIFGIHTLPKFPVGYRLQRQDGNEFVYSHFGAATNRGLIVAQDISESGIATVQDNLVIAPASAVAVAGNLPKPGAIGSNFVQITLASIGANDYAGGYLITADATGEGYTYRIKGNTATDNPSTGDIRIELYEKLQVALDTTSDIQIVGSKYSNLEAATTGTDNFAVGVACSTMAAGEYGWICVKGVVGLLVDGTIAIGEMITISDSEAGQVQVAGGGSTAVVDLIDERIIGQCLVAAGASTEHSAFYVNIS